MIHSFQDNSIAQSLEVPPEIHVEDHLYRFLSEHPRLKHEALAHYFHSARESAQRVRDLILGNRRPQGLSEIALKGYSLLDFASGFGMLNRHFRKVIPEATVEACDIHPKAIEFHERYLGTPCHLSHESPGAFSLERRYDVVLAISFFSHMPQASWLPWLEALSARVQERGLLIFTAHGPSSGVSVSGHVIRRQIDFSFVAKSEQLDLDQESYGTSYAHPRFVMRLIHQLPHMHLSEYKMGAWWGGNQDTYVLCKQSKTEQLALYSPPTGR